MKPQQQVLESDDIQEFFDLSLDMLAIACTDGYFKRLNPAWERTLGHANATLLAEPYLDFVHPEDREPTIREAQALSQGKSTIAFENRYRCSDGSYKWLLWKATPVLGTDRIIAVARDITDRKQYEQALVSVNAALEDQVQEQSEELEEAVRSLEENRKILQRLVSNLPGMAYRCRNDDSWTMLYVSNGVFELTGYRRADLVKNRTIAYADLIELEDREFVEQEVQRAIRRKTRFQMEYRIRTATGEQKWVWEQGRGVYGEDGELLHLEGLILDVTERMEAEATVRQQAALLDEARDAIFVCDLHDRILFWNKGAERVFGYTADEVKDTSAAALLTPGSSAEFDEAFRETLEHGYWSGECRKPNKDGGEIVIECRWSLLRDDKGKARGALAIATDITHRKRLEEQLLRAQRMESVGTLASGIAHDLNNALTPVLMGVQMLRRRCGDRDGQILDMLESGAQRGARLVKQVLTFGRGIAGEPVALQLRHAVKELERVTERTFPRSIRLRVDMPKDLWSVSADPTQIDQVLMNLAINARDAMPNGGTLSICGKNVDVDAAYAEMQPNAKPGPYVQIEVTDTGEGMPPEVRERVFEPFFTTKKVGKGTGLGLSTVHTIVKNHDGFVTVYSEVGRGTTFKLYIPATEEEQIVPVRTEAPVASGHGEVILVVDDEDGVREMVSTFLTDAGYAVVGVRNGAEAVARYAKGGVAVVLVDWEMPVMNGRQTVQAIQSMDPEARIIASSGMPHEDEITSFDRPIGFLPKPYNANDLLSKLAGVVSGPKGSHESTAGRPKDRSKSSTA